MNFHSFPMTTPHPSTRGFTYIELLLAVTISAILVTGLMGVVNTALLTGDDVRQRNDLTRQARFAMQRMVQSVSHSQRLLLPLNDNPGTNWPEHIREQTVPPSPPVGSSTFASAVLAITLPLDIDLDDNGVPDADNDGDGRIDEDIGSDNNNDGAPGILFIDDNGDGTMDVSLGIEPNEDNDEDNNATEDPVDGIDNDGDGSIDEDVKADMNGDGLAGLSGVDDDNDGAIDEEHSNDDDEDTVKDEDWYDPVVFYLSGNQLIERTPVPWDTNADSVITGADFIESVISDNVTHFRVERINYTTGTASIDLILQLTDPDSGEKIKLQTIVRVGGNL